MTYPKDVGTAMRNEAAIYNMLVGMDRQIGGLSRQYEKEFTKPDEEIVGHLIKYVAKDLKDAGFEGFVFSCNPGLPFTVPGSVAEFQASFLRVLVHGGLPAAGEYLSSLDFENDNFVKRQQTQL